LGGKTKPILGGSVGGAEVVASGGRILARLQWSVVSEIEEREPAVMEERQNKAN